MHYLPGRRLLLWLPDPHYAKGLCLRAAMPVRPALPVRRRMRLHKRLRRSRIPPNRLMRIGRRNVQAALRRITF